MGDRGCFYIFLKGTEEDPGTVIRQHLPGNVGFPDGTGCFGAGSRRSDQRTDRFCACFSGTGTGKYDGNHSFFKKRSGKSKKGGRVNNGSKTGTGQLPV